MENQSKNRRDLERREVRERIIEAARELFASQGYDAVTMRSIAKKINYTAPAIYFHFSGKEELFKEICARDFRALAALLARPDADASPVGRLRRIGEEYIRFAFSHPGHYRFMFMTLLPEVKAAEIGINRHDPAEDSYAYLKSCVEECLGAGLFRPEYTDPELISQTLWAGVHGVVSLYIIKGEEEWVAWRGLDLAAATMSDVLLQGMLTVEAFRG
jgi:AcrR family transcriptional regulator